MTLPFHCFIIFLWTHETFARIDSRRGVGSLDITSLTHEGKSFDWNLRVCKVGIFQSANVQQALTEICSPRVCILEGGAIHARVFECSTTQVGIGKVGIDLDKNIKRVVCEHTQCHSIQYA